MRIRIDDVNVAKTLLNTLEKFQLELEDSYLEFIKYYENAHNEITSTHDVISKEYDSASVDLEQASKDLDEALNSLADCQATETEETTTDGEGNEITTVSTPDCSSEESATNQATEAYQTAQENYDKARNRYEQSCAVYDKLTTIESNFDLTRAVYTNLSQEIPISLERLELMVDVFERALSFNFLNQNSNNESETYKVFNQSSYLLNSLTRKNSEEKSVIPAWDETSRRKAIARISYSRIKGEFFEETIQSWCKTNNVLTQVRTMDVYFNENYNQDDEFGEDEIIYTDQKNVIDFYFEDTASIWEAKSGYKTSRVKYSQLETYKQLLELGYFYRDNSDNKKYEVKEVNYLFDSIEGLRNNIDLLKGTGVTLWFQDENGEPQIFNE